MRYWLALACLLAVACMGLTWWLWTPPIDTVSYQGRGIGEWFAYFLARPHSDWIFGTPAPPPKSAQVIVMEMEGDAVPFLARKANQGPIALKRLYLSAVAKLPRKLRKWLPPGRPDPREPAIRLLGGIGQIQKTKLWSGRPSLKPSAALALPALQAALRDPEIVGLWPTRG